MLKKFMIGSMGFLFLGSTALFSYRAMEPVAAVTQPESYISAAPASSRSLSETTAETAAGETLYVYFCTADSADCTYMNDYVLKPLAQELNATSLDVFEYQDLSGLGENYPVSKLKSQYGFESYPAFVAMTVNEDGTTTINNVLEWNSESPIDSQTLKLWMIDQGIWTGVIEDQGELIEQPAQQ